MNGFSLLSDPILMALLLFLALSAFGLITTLILYYFKRPGLQKSQRKPAHNVPQNYSTAARPDSDHIRDYGINEILSSGKFTAAERKAEYRRRGKSPSGVIDGVYNDMYRGNETYSDAYRDWDADA